MFVLQNVHFSAFRGAGSLVSGTVPWERVSVKGSVARIAKSLATGKGMDEISIC